MDLTGERKVKRGTSLASLPLMEEEEEEGRLWEESLGGGLAAPGGPEDVIVGVFRRSAKKYLT